MMSSGGLAFCIAILVTPLLIRWLRRRRIGQQIRHDGPASHSVKAGTPTMGGIAMVCAVVLGYLGGHLGTDVRFGATGMLVVIAVCLFGAIGLLDDWIKVRNRRSLGLNKRAKFFAQVGAAVSLLPTAVSAILREPRAAEQAISDMRAAYNAGKVAYSLAYAALVLRGAEEDTARPGNQLRWLRLHLRRVEKLTNLLSGILANS